jgi:NADH dehydrogenase [ubiquinone] 1 alpha subcomplex assembly factor 6
MSNALSYMAEEARRHDRDRFLCTLFAPEETREALFTLLAFNAEIAKSREMVREALLGEIRLQWWRDIIERLYNDPEGEIEDHAVVAALAKNIRQHNLSRHLFDELINARSRDMIDEPPKDQADLRNYAVGTSATLSALMMEASSASIEREVRAAKHVGVAWSLTGILRASSIFAKYKRVFIPQSVMQECGFDAYAFMDQKSTPAIQQGVRQLVDMAEAEITQARALTQGRANKQVCAIFLQASLAEMYLKRIIRLDYNPFDRKIEGGRALRQLRLGFKAVRGSF